MASNSMEIICAQETASVSSCTIQDFSYTLFPQYLMIVILVIFLFIKIMEITINKNK